MASFDTAFRKTAKNEGGYSNDPDDSGGETYAGISRKNFPGWRGWQFVDRSRSDHSFPSCLDYNDNLKELIRIFYRQQFWNVIQGDKIKEQDIADSLYDSSVNMGCRQAIVLIQRAMKINESGTMDDYTLERLNG